MSIFRNDKQKQSRRQPDHVGRFENVGLACWLNQSGDHDIRVGEAVQRGRNLYARTVLPISMLPEACEVIKSIAETFSNDESVPRELRQTLRQLAERLELALDHAPPVGPVNGSATPNFYNAA